MTAVPADQLGAAPLAADAQAAAGTPGTGRLSTGLMAIFSGPSFPLAALALPLVVYLPHFYAAHMGISLAAVGGIFSLVRLLDIGFDPILGGIMDRTSTRFGRFKPWMAASMPLLMLAAVLVFMPPKGVGAPYLIGALVLLYVGFSMVVLSHLAWASTLATDYHARSRIYGWIQAGSVGGLILVMILPVIIAKVSKNGDAAAVASMGWFVILLTPVTFLLALWKVKEPVTAVQSHAAANIGQYWKVVRRPAVLRITAATILIASAPGVTGAIFLFFFRQARGFSPSDANLLLLIYFVGGLLGAPIWSKLAKRIGKHRAMIASCAYYVVMQGTTLLQPRASMAIVGPMIFLAGLAFSAYLILLRAMAADACDEARLDVGADCTGMIYALHNAGGKVGSALGVVITFPLLARLGFVAKEGAANSPAAIGALQLVFVLLPIAFIVLGALSLVGYHLTEEHHGKVRSALEARDAAGAA